MKACARFAARTTWLAAAPFLVMGGTAGAAVTMQGAVTLDYYVGNTDSQGFEHTDSRITVDHIDNTGSGASGPLSLSGWLTKQTPATGAGSEIGNAPLGQIPANSSLSAIDETVTAADATPGEYYPHVLLQDDSAPGTFEDTRDLTPAVLWRGGLEAVGPMSVAPYAAGTQVTVDFAQLRNNRLDSQYTNDIIVTLYATLAPGPASSGFTLCSTKFAGLFAGASLASPGFSCALNAVPDGDYTLHLDVAENGGRGGHSTLSGPVLSFRGGYIWDGSTGNAYATGSTSSGLLAVMAGFLVLRLRRWREKAPALLAVALAVTASAPAAATDRNTQADLDQLLAPIALYPDGVLSHVLIAATYPLDVAQAARWSRAHPDLQGQQAVDAVEGKRWDASVKALAAFPEILARMDEDLDWTERLGEAFLEDQGAVMDRVQFLRERAYEEGHLGSLDHVRVVREREMIYIEPAVTEVVYVPYYDPWYVYGSWWWPEYPPYCWHYWGGHAVSYYSPGFYWGVGFVVAPTFYSTSFYWPQHQVVVARTPERPFYSGRSVAHGDDFRVWHHEPDRVRGMHYRSEGAERGERHDGSRPPPEARIEPRPMRREIRREPWDERVERNERQTQQWREEERRDMRREIRDDARPEIRSGWRGAPAPRREVHPRGSEARSESSERGHDDARPQPQFRSESRGTVEREESGGRGHGGNQEHEERREARRPRQNSR